jgi:hypothetical protein
VALSIFCRPFSRSIFGSAGLVIMNRIIDVSNLIRIDPSPVCLAAPMAAA